ncbi:MAG: phenylalanine--tRNA ligase beta subunit-related protein [Candidatus Omnitrophica bacterium]|nr:phenylalanine--tRNA ligase beta subunit-related protein [Candidatus Omnitrophota bacterium]MCM8831329.1 phenylalanine--tRNA ligase beta subunit-related protein [Candidatus Omnitrophota bacterium]
MFLIIVEKNLKVKLATAYIEGVSIRLDTVVFEKLKKLSYQYRQKYINYPISKIENVSYARKLFKSIGLDPTKHRPSSEALLNRALKGKEIYSINNLVDVGNWCSLEFLLTICVYDVDKIVGKILHVRTGKEDEGYLALNKRFINLENRILIADEIGPFGSPLIDSQRTAITLETKNAFLGIYAPSDYDDQKLKSHIFLFAERVKEFCGGDLLDIKIALPNSDI